MSSKSSGSDRLRFVHILVLLPFILLGCGGGWDAYRDVYDAPSGEPPGQPWVGDETVFVVLGQSEVETALEGIVTSDFQGGGAVRLSELIEESEITDNPEQFRYNFIATDDPNPYNLLVKRNGDLSLLPNRENMQHGFLYLDQGDLKTGWDPAEQPWGTSVSAYNVKYMNGGTIELLTP